MERTEINISGFGGQGVILSAYIVGKAASIFDNKYSTMIQSFGPEARGSACSAAVIIDPNQIDYPYITKPEVLIAMSQEAYRKFEPGLGENGILITEEDLIQIDHPPRKGIKHFTVPATRLAEELGKKMVLNIVMVGFFTAVTNLIQVDAMKNAVRDSVPKGTEELNLKAFQKGFDYGKEVLSKAN